MKSKFEYDPKRPYAIICDLDGTLINCDHRLHHIKKTPKDWDSFFSDEELKKDSINPYMRCMLESYLLHFRWIFITGRPEKTREQTMKFLKNNLISLPHQIFFRPEGDYRNDDILKKEIYDLFVKDKYNVLYVFEDRSRVVKMWRSLGLYCFQCDEGDF